jgi:hypothetical protein
MRLRVGPFSASTSGRVGIHTGPVSMSAGGRRRRSSGGGGELIAFLLVVALVVFVVMWPLSLWGHAIHLTPSWHQLMNRNKAWLHEHYPLVGLRYLGAGAALLVAIGGVVAFAVAATEPARQREAERAEAEHAARLETLAAQRAAQLEAAAAQRARQEKARREAHERWLNSPPPSFRPPPRFTQTWLEANVPRLHPGQVPMLLDELRARGWNDARIEQRIQHLLPKSSTVSRA